jgi:hypothetical protein
MLSTAQTGPQFLAEQLERLLVLRLDTKADVERWYPEAEAVQTALKRFPTFEFPHHIWQYFADADIRHRDPEYRESLEKAIRGYMAKMCARQPSNPAMVRTATRLVSPRKLATIFSMFSTLAPGRRRSPCSR